MVFRWCRISVLLMVLGVVLLGIFVNRVGLPESAKARLVAGLRAQGWDVQFSRLRLHWYRGLVAEDLQLHRTNHLAGPNLFIEEAACRFRTDALWRGRIEVAAVQLDNARLIWPLAGRAQPARNLFLDQLAGELRFLPEDAWELRALQAKFLGARLQLSGTIRHASALRAWSFPASSPSVAAVGESSWHRVMTGLKQVRFTSQPELFAEFDGDARDLKSFSASLRFLAREADSPWGRATNLALHTRLVPPAHSNDLVRAECQLTADDARTPWAGAARLKLETQLVPSMTQLFPTNARVTVELQSATSRWGEAREVRATVQAQPQATNAALRLTRVQLVARDYRHESEQAARAELDLRVLHGLTNYLPAEVWADLALTGAQTRWAAAPSAQVAVHAVLPPTNQFRLWNTNLVWPERLENLPLELSATLAGLDAPRLKLDQVSCTNHWRFPELQLEVTTDLAGERLAASATLNVTNGKVLFHATNSLEPARFAALLSTNVQRALLDFTWATPPRAEVGGRFVLPAWAHRAPDWAAEVGPTLSLRGQVRLRGGAFRGFRFTAAEVPVTLTNLFWQMPAFQLTRPEGVLTATGELDQRTRAGRVTLASAIDPQSLRPFFPRPQEQRVFDFFKFSEPPHLRAEFRGRWGDPQSLGFTAAVALTNASFRDEAVGGVTARVEYTNLFVHILEPQVWRTNWHGRADGLGIDVADERLYLTNARGTIDPYALTRAIGPNAARAIASVQFANPPTGRAHGMVDLTARRLDDDMHFSVEGGPFQWLHFRLDHVKGAVHWLGNQVMLTNLSGSAKGAGVAGDAHLDFSRGPNPAYSFNLALVEADLKALHSELTPTTNRLEGLVDGTLSITHALADDPKSWQGHGYAHLRDGLIWEVPIFGIFSPVLDAMAPGLGRSRAKEATASFTISNSVVHTTDLEIRATAMRMLYQGAVDFDRNVEGKMEAELLRDLPAIGPVLKVLLSPVTKLFVYRVTGTLDQPKKEPLYTIPRVLLMPFQPIKTLKEMFGPDEKKSEDKPAQ